MLPSQVNLKGGPAALRAIALSLLTGLLVTAVEAQGGAAGAKAPAVASAAEAGARVTLSRGEVPAVGRQERSSRTPPPAADPDRRQSPYLAERPHPGRPTAIHTCGQRWGLGCAF